MSVQIKNVAKVYSQGLQNIEVLKGLNAQIEDGEIVAIVGQSGSGKSTLLSLLAGLDQPTAGSIQIDGVNLQSLDQKQMTEFRGKKIGIVFQQFHLIPHLTALENVMIPLEIASDNRAMEKAHEVLTQVGLAHRMNHFPAQLSGGENQRVAIARALVVEPAILLADEPSGNLDIETGKQVMDVFFDIIIKNKITTILVTHSPEIADRCKRKLILRSGML